jgi:hypothetical protein
VLQYVALAIFIVYEAGGGHGLPVARSSSMVDTQVILVGQHHAPYAFPYSHCKTYRIGVRTEWGKIGEKICVYHHISIFDTLLIEVNFPQHSHITLNVYK